MPHVVLGLIAAVLGIAATVRVFEPRVAFFPTAGETDTPADFGIPFEAATIDTRDGVTLRAWSLPHPAPKADVLYFHGNGGNLSVWAPILAGIYQHGFSVRALDYRGYGASTGRPSERGLYRDVDAFIAWAQSLPGGSRPAIYWGRSLGTTMAAYAASVAAPQGVILESGFPDARTLLRASPPLAFAALFSSYRFPTAEYLAHVDVPVLVMHGDRDRVVPFAAGRALFERIHEPKRFVTIRGGDHNDAVPRDADAYWSAVDALAAGDIR